MSHIRHRRTCTLVALVGAAALAGVLAGCSSGPGTAADKVAAVAGLTTPADKLAAAIKAQAAKLDTSTRQVAETAASTTNVNGGGESGTRARPGTVRLGVNHGWVVVDGVQGYKGTDPTTKTEVMIVVDGGVCTLVRGSDTSLTDVIVTVLASCPPD